MPENFGMSVRMDWSASHMPEKSGPLLRVARTCSCCDAYAVSEPAGAARLAHVVPEPGRDRAGGNAMTAIKVDGDVDQAIGRLPEIGDIDHVLVANA